MYSYSRFLIVFLFRSPKNKSFRIPAESNVSQLYAVACQAGGVSISCHPVVHAEDLKTWKISRNPGLLYIIIMPGHYDTLFTERNLPSLQYPNLETLGQGHITLNLPIMIIGGFSQNGDSVQWEDGQIYPGNDLHSLKNLCFFRRRIYLSIQYPSWFSRLRFPKIKWSIYRNFTEYTGFPG